MLIKLNDLLSEVRLIWIIIDNGSQNYLVFQPVFKYLQTFTGTDKSFALKFKWLSKESFKTLVTLVTVIVLLQNWLLFITEE